MAATTIDIEEDLPYPHTRFRVYTSPSALNADWTEQDYLRPDTLQLMAGPAIDECQLHLEIGYFSNRNDSPFGISGSRALIVEPLEVDRHYVKIEMLDDDDEVAEIWVGRIASSEQQATYRSVEIDGDPQMVKTGTQAFTAYGLLWDWENTIVASSWVRVRDTEEIIDPERGIPFNYVDRAGGYTLRGNKDTQSGDSNPVFSWESWSDQQWSANDALTYLARRFPPQTPAGNEAVAIDITGADLSWYDISVQTERRSAKSILDELVDRRRLAGYYLKPKEIGSSVFCDLILFTFTGESLDVGDDTIPANTDQIELNVRSNPLCSSAVLRSVATHVADRIVVEGAYITSTFTGFGSGVFNQGWEDDKEQKFTDGAGNGDEDENTLVRCRDELKDVFSRVIVAENWPQLLDGNWAITVQPEALPADLDDGDIPGLFNNPAITNPWRHVASRFLDYIAIRDEDTNEFRRPFVLFPEAQVAGNKFVYADQASVGDRQFACHLHMLHDQLGYQLTVNRSGGNSLLAVSNWPDPDGATPESLDPNLEDTWAFNWLQARFTATVEWDDRCSATHVINATGDGAERVVRIMAEDARLDIVIPQTIIDIDENGEPVVSSGSVLVDDRARLKTIAEAAGEWYGTPRKALTLTYNSLRQFVSIGQLVTELVDNGEAEEVNTPITGLSINFREGTTTIETSYADADFSTNRSGV